MDSVKTARDLHRAGLPSVLNRSSSSPRYARHLFAISRRRCPQPVEPDRSLGVRQVPWAAATLAAIALVASTAVPASAQVPPGAWPRCIPERDGQELALGGSACECRHE